MEQHKISTPKTGIQDLVVTHYDCSPKHITNMQYYKLNKIGERKIKPAYFKILPHKYKSFHKFGNYKYALTPYTLNLSTRKVFVTKCHSKEVLDLITIIGLLKIWKNFFPTEIEARRELARFGLISKHHSRTQMIQFDALGHCPPNHATKATLSWELENHCRIFDVGRSHARLIKF